MHITCKYNTYLYDMAVYIRKYHFHPGIFPVHCIIKVFTEFFQTFDSYFTIAMFEKVLEKRNMHYYYATWNWYTSLFCYNKRKEEDWLYISYLTSTMLGCTASKYSEHFSVSDFSSCLSTSSSWSVLENTTGQVRLQVFHHHHMQKHIPQCASWEGISVEESRDSDNHVWVSINWDLSLSATLSQQCFFFFYYRLYWSNLYILLRVSGFFDGFGMDSFNETVLHCDLGCQNIADLCITVQNAAVLWFNIFFSLRY